MKIKILGKTKDLRTNTNVVYAQISINDYLELVGDDFDKFSIQRRKVTSNKAYDRMKNDIQNGALLPCITLSIEPNLVDEFLPLVENDDLLELEHRLCRPGQVNILDGLQRTYILKDLEKRGIQFRPEQLLLVEFWFEAEIRNLIYRIIVLNAGQKRMSMRHQVEILFSTFRNILEDQIPGLEIYQEKEGSSRKKPRRYSLDRIVTSYQCYLLKSPETQKENIVAQELMEEDALSASEKDLGDEFEYFKKYLIIYSNLDEKICRIYPGDKSRAIPKGIEWFGSEPVMNSYFAAIALYGLNQQRLDIIDMTLKKLEISLNESTEGDDPLGLEDLQKIINGYNPRQVNLGYVTRKLMTSAFREYFQDQGESLLSQCWQRGAE